MILSCVTYILVVVVVISFGKRKDPDNEFISIWMVGKNYYESEISNPYNKGNFFISPMSVSYALLTLLIGASGNTFKELQKVTFQKQYNRKEIEFNNHHVTGSIEEASKLVLEIKLFLDKKITVQHTFLQKLSKNNHLFKIEQVDFSGQLQKSRQAIENFFKVTTYLDFDRDKIIFDEGTVQFIDKKSIDEKTTAVLAIKTGIPINWSSFFDPWNFDKKKFYGLEKDYEVTMMYAPVLKHTGAGVEYKYKEDKRLDAQFLEIAFHGLNIRLVFILPKNKKGINKLEKKLLSQAEHSEIPIGEYVEGFKNVPVEVYLPKFNHSVFHRSFENQLKRMGVKEIFKSSADFQYISKKKFHIDKVLQKTAFIGVEEFEETTGWNGDTEWKKDPHYKECPDEGVCQRDYKKVKGAKVFNANHPFVYMIIQGHSADYSMLLYVGKYLHPNQDESLTQIIP